MAGITDTVFRLLIRELGAQVVISDLLSAEGMVRRGARTLDMMQFDERERPVGIQIFGSSPASLTEACRIVQGEGADFVDLNLGCPVKKVVGDGGGAAWLRDPVKLGQLLTQMKSAIRIPLTIKVRTGWDESSRNLHEVIKVAADSGVAWVAVHGRTRAQGYSGLADWELIRDAAQASPIPIIGNGDILSAEKANERIAGGYAHGVMIGRGALKNPWMFREILGHSFERNLAELVERHFELALEKKGRQRAFLSLKKFLSWYAAGYPGCSRFRASIFTTDDVDNLKSVAMEYFATLGDTPPVLDNQPFLMGGHG